VVNDDVTPDARRLRALLAAKAEPILEAARTFRVISISVVGSVARGDATPASDIDLLIRAHDDFTLFDLTRLHRQLETILGVSVDLIEPYQGMTCGTRDPSLV
jgi:predicted nucleotidyltransferase